MTDLTPVPGKQPTPPSPLDKLSRQELKTAALAWLGKAKDKHQEAREWQNRALLAEARLAVLEAEKEITGIIQLARDLGTPRSKEKS